MSIEFSVAVERDASLAMSDTSVSDTAVPDTSMSEISMSETSVSDTLVSNTLASGFSKEGVLRFSFSDEWNLGETRELWQALEKKAEPNAYLSWSWISAWLTTCAKAPYLLQTYNGSRLVGLGFLSPEYKNIGLGLSVKKLWLHRTGCDRLDQVWIEHNDFLLDTETADETRAAIIDFLQYRSGFDELYIGLCSDKGFDHSVLAAFKPRNVLAMPTYSVELSSYDSKDDYLKSLSKNTRSQITRTQRRVVEKYGELQLTLASTPAEKQEYLRETATYHRQRWAASEFGSGFDNDAFIEFHQHLLLNDSSNDVSRLYKLHSAEETFGYIYLLTDADSWKFYLSAIRFDDDNRIKIGLLFHTLVIEQAIAEGVDLYDFLAGEARYKKSLSHIDEKQTMYCFYRPSALTKIREILRTIKRVLLP